MFGNPVECLAFLRNMNEIKILRRRRSSSKNYQREKYGKYVFYYSHSIVAGGFELMS